MAYLTEAAAALRSGRGTDAQAATLVSNLYARNHIHAHTHMHTRIHFFFARAHAFLVFLLLCVTRRTCLCVSAATRGWRPSGATSLPDQPPAKAAKG